MIWSCCRWSVLDGGKQEPEQAPVHTKQQMGDTDWVGQNFLTGEHSTKVDVNLLGCLKKEIFQNSICIIMKNNNVQNVSCQWDFYKTMYLNKWIVK